MRIKDGTNKRGPKITPLSRLPLAGEWVEESKKAKPSGWKPTGTGWVRGDEIPHWKPPKPK